MLRVRLLTDPFDLSSFDEHEVESLMPFLKEQFPTWPATARIYKDDVSLAHDVTPNCEADLEALQDGDLYYVVVYPGDPVTMLIVAVAVFVVATVALLFLMPKMPGQQGSDAGASSTNSLGNRVNKARPNGRIPDIFGKVRAIPELLTVPLLMFEDNREFELCYMAVGRGEYEIDADQVYDGQTPLDLIAGAAADFYGPNTRPGSGAPFLEIGGGIGYPLKNVLKLNEVNGQKLSPPNANQMTGQGNIKLVGPASIVANPASDIDFTERFGPGSNLTLSNATFGGIAVFDATTQVCRFHSDKRLEFQTWDPRTLYTAGQLLVLSNAGFAGVHATSGAVIYADVSGTYTIVSVTATTIQLA